MSDSEALSTEQTKPSGDPADILFQEDPGFEPERDEGDETPKTSENESLNTMDGITEITKPSDIFVDAQNAEDLKPAVSSGFDNASENPANKDAALETLAAEIGQLSGLNITSLTQADFLNQNDAPADQSSAESIPEDLSDSEESQEQKDRAQDLANVVPFGGGRDNHALRLISGNQDQEAFQKLAETLGDRLSSLGTNENLSNNSAGLISPDDELIRPYEISNISMQHSKSLITILDALDDGFVVFRDRTLFYSNSVFLKLVGQDTLDQFAKSGGFEAIFNSLADMAQAHEDSKIITLHALDGISRHISVFLTTITWDHLPATMLTVREIAPLTNPVGDAYIEIAERRARRAEQRVRELKKLIDFAVSGSLTLDDEGHILAATPAASRLISKGGRSIVGEMLIDFLDVDQRAEFTHAFNDVFKHSASPSNAGKRIIVKLQNDRATAKVLRLSMIKGEVEDNQVRIFCGIDDVSEWIDAQHDLEVEREEAVSKSHNKTDFINALSHEIRTPLNAILGFSEIIAEQELGPIENAKYVEYAQDIHKSGKYALSLTNDLLDMAQIEQGKKQLNIEPVDINEIASDCIHLMETDANREQVILRHQIEDHLPIVSADARSMRQIMLNLLSNAVKFTPQGGQVILSTRRETDGHVSINIKDTGIGMTMEEISRSLKPFEQINDYQNTGLARQGSGLGLPLTKALIEANGGEFKITSTPDKGTTVQAIFKQLN